MMKTISKLICSCQGAREGVRGRREKLLPKPNQFTLCGGNSLEVPPVPIPNTEVKLQYVEDTWLVTARKNRSLPHFLSPRSVCRVGLFVVSKPLLL